MSRNATSCAECERGLWPANAAMSPDLVVGRAPAAAS
jgi:hypothetical protein